jgi:Tfp pilus assembly protein PilF
MGNCFAQLGMFAEAIERYDRSIQIDPFAPDPRIKKEEIISKKGK